MKLKTTSATLRVLVGAAVATSVLLAIDAASANAAVVTAAPNWPITTTTSGPPPIPTLPAGGDATPPAEQIADPVTAAASCTPWHQQSSYGERWPATSTWWEYRCSYENDYYSNQCTSGACNGFCWYCYWQTQVWTDYFYWDGSAAIFYGEVYSNDVVWEGDLLPPSSSTDWWDASTGQWYGLGPALTVSTSGRGAGQVSSDPAGISCGATCRASFDPGSTITLTATPDASSVFAGWSGDCTGTGACQVTMDQAHKVEAIFEPKTFQLTVTTAGSGHGVVYFSPGGLGCDRCHEPYDIGTVVTLTATPDSSSVFTGWSGDCTGTGACQVTMNQARAVAATFTFTGNAPPQASFTASCSYLTCSFDGSASTDTDGVIAGYAWSFGDGSSATGGLASHSYAQPGSYTVTLTVTDNAGATGSQATTIRPIELSARGYKQYGVENVNLSWTGPEGASVTIDRNSAALTTVAATTYTDTLGKIPGSYTYRVCAVGGTTCSNQVTVSF